MKDLRVCEGCGGWREKYRVCEECGWGDMREMAPPEPEGNSRSLRRLLKNKRRK
ncbi:hypothetical protein [Pseudophaeobacter arcticus]|uniref:hypothetical protein n=1 Tax=Pseudophaeobacter arcticus TaxID=385492 RepID=UPI001377194B|nr:hypothetical protein [Pseudophaeobacter arcticus]